MLKNIERFYKLQLMKEYIRPFLWVGLGGMIGSMLRFGVSVFFTNVLNLKDWPIATFAVNIIGSFLIGIAVGSINNLGDENQQLLRYLFIVGFCGGFTTFSTFSLEGFDMIKSQGYYTFALYTISSVICGVLAVLVGMWTMR